MSTSSGAIELRSDAVVSLESLCNSDIAVSNGIKIGIGVDLLESEIGTLATESSSDHHRECVVENVENCSVDDARVSGDERGIVLENAEKSSIDDARVSGDERGVVLESVEEGSIDDASVSGDERGIVVENAEKSSIDAARVSGDESGIVLKNVEKDSIDDFRVSGDERVLETVEKTSIHDARVPGDERGIVLENVEKSSIDDARVSGDEKGCLLENVEKTSIDDARVSGEERGITLENVEEGSISDARVSGEEIGIASENVEKSSIDDARVSGDERVSVLENVEKGSDENGVNDEEKEGEYKVSDLVWAKVKSYPWWPGQIFDPSASTNKAKKYSRKDRFLIAYFGDHTFAWNDASKIKPFRKNFSKMEKQSNSKAFYNAVNCALDEGSRRVEFGLACSCLSEEVYSKIKTQIFVNSGIRNEFSRIDGGDNFSTVATFKPVNIVQSVQDLAKEHFDGISRLEVSCVRAQILAFFRWKGYYQFPSHQLLDGSDTDNKIKDNPELPLMVKEKMVKDAKPDSRGGKVLSKKRKSKTSDHVNDSGMIARKKQRFLKNKHSIRNGSSSVPNRDDKVKKDGVKRKTVESNGFKEETENKSTDKNSSSSSPKKLFRVGDSICKIARQLSQSPPILKKESQILKTPKSHMDQSRKGIDHTDESAHGSEVTEANSAAALILKFTNLDSIPSLSNLNEIFSRYGALREMETEVIKKSNCAKVVFASQSSAETAFSSAGKFSIFGPALISYRLDYSPTPRKKQNRKNG